MTDISHLRNVSGPAAMNLRTSNTGATGLQTTVTSVDETYEALALLPAVVRTRLAEATLPIDPISLLRYYEAGIAMRYSPSVMEAKVIEAIEATEEAGALALERGRSAWRR